MGSTLIVRGLQKTYGARQVVHDVSLDVASGEVVGLLGPNGAGKTTSFYMIVGLVPSDGGEITLDGARIEAAWWGPLPGKRPTTGFGPFQGKAARNFRNSARGRSASERIRRPAGIASRQMP